MHSLMGEKALGCLAPLDFLFCRNRPSLCWRCVVSANGDPFYISDLSVFSQHEKMLSGGRVRFGSGHESKLTKVFSRDVRIAAQAG